MKLKAGDKVRVLPRKENWRGEGPGYVKRMQDFENQVFEVVSVGERCVNLKNNIYTWLEKWLEKVEENPCAFKVGEEYKSRDGLREYTFKAFFPDAQASDQAVFLSESGGLVTRHASGQVYATGLHAGDILLEASFEPKVGTWETREDETVFVTHFEPGSDYPICGVDKDGEPRSWNADGWDLEPGTQLVRYLGPLPEEMTTWKKG